MKRTTVKPRTLGVCVAISCCALAFSSGCSAMGNSRDARFERARGEYAPVDKTSETTWASARESEKEGTRVALKPVEVRAAWNDESGADRAPTFADRVRGAFHIPTPPTNDPALTDSRRDSYASSDGGFWSKMFPSKRSRETASSDPVVVPVPSRAPAAGNRAERTAPKGLSLPTSRLLGRSTRPTGSKAYRSEIDAYDQSRFMPSYRDIEKYYYPSGSAGASSASAAPISAYGASIFRDRDGDADSAPRNGSAFISPIVRSDATAPDPRSGSARANSLGTTRPASKIGSRGIAQVSYDRPAKSSGRPSLDSLFGWSEETSETLDSLDFSSEVPAARESSGDFFSTLGRQIDYSLLDSGSSTRASSSVDAARERAPEAAPAPVETRAATNERAASAPLERERNTIVAEPGASLDDIFDSAVASASEIPEPRDVLNEPEDEFESGSDSLDAPIQESPVDLSRDLFDEFPSRPTPPSELDEDVDESADDVFDSFPEVAASAAEPLEESEALEELESAASLREDVLARAAKTIDESPAPDRVAERRDNPSDMPLSREEIEWVGQIKNAIAALLRERDAATSKGLDSRALDARLRLLYLVVGEYDRSIQEIRDDSDPLKVFWEKECRGLETLLQNRVEEIDPSFVAERLSSGLDSLTGLCDLKIRKALLVEEPACYGLYRERKGSFSQGDELYAYAELDYASSRETLDGFAIDVECRWRLVDVYGNVVMPFESQRCSNVSETKLRDVVLNVSVPLPTKLAPGEYVLELEVVDRNAKEPTASIKRMNFTVGATSET